MYGIIKDVIKSKNYELTDMLAKIDKRCFENQITEEERDELQALARANADMTKSIDVFAKLQELEMRIKTMEEKKADEPTDEVIEPFVLGKWYYNGDKCSENGKNFICTAPEGTVCTWSPSNYPPYWKEI
jgi:acyl-CoA reductase-like NAD-dependent aldehyde dehydrogenase